MIKDLLSSLTLEKHYDIRLGRHKPLAPPIYYRNTNTYKCGNLECKSKACWDWLVPATDQSFDWLLFEAAEACDWLPSIKRLPSSQQAKRWLSTITIPITSLALGNISGNALKIEIISFPIYNSWNI